MNILIIGGSGNAPSANSVCVRNMAQEFIRQGHKVWNLAAGDDCVNKPGDIGGAELWQIPEGWYGRYAKRILLHPSPLKRLFFKVVSAIRHLLLLFSFPITEPLRSRRLLNKARALVKEHNITLVVAIYNCYENIYSGMMLKKQYKDRIKVVSYHLDLRTANTNTSAAVRNYVHRHALRSMVEESRVVDNILIPYSGQSDAEKVEGILMDKLLFVGFPVFINEGPVEKCELPFEKGVINISYIGTLSKDNRNPRYVLKLLEQVVVQTGQKVMVHFWGNVGDAKITLEDSSIATYHGTIENRYVRFIMDNSDFLLNIGNTIAYDMLPSKVFGIFATGKPIINVITHPLDATLTYFERYNHSINLKEYSPSSEDVKILADGMKRMMDKPLRETTGLFEDFKPKTICDVILK